MIDEKEFWELCGFRKKETLLRGGGDWILALWVSPNGEETYMLPSIHSLDALFRWAVPVMGNYEMYKGTVIGKPATGKHIARVWTKDDVRSDMAFSDDPALALAEACYKALKGGKDGRS